MGTAAGYRLAARTRLRNRHHKATPLGKLIIDRTIEREMTLKEVTTELRISYLGSRAPLRRLLWEPGYWPTSRTRRVVARFLDQPLIDVEQLLLEGTRRPQRIECCKACGNKIRRFRSQKRRKTRLCDTCFDQARRVNIECALDRCRIIFSAQRSRAKKGRLHFCCRDHHTEWQRGRRAPRRIVAVAGNQQRRQPSGRRLARIIRLASESSIVKVAENAGVSPATVQAIRSGKRTTITPIVRYRLELVGELPQQKRPLLTETILDFCLKEDLTPTHLARRVGIDPGSLLRIIQSGGARPSTLAKLAPVMGRNPEELEVQCDRDRFRHPRTLARALFQGAVRASREPNVDVILAEVRRRHPRTDDEALRQYVVGLIRNWRGQPAAEVFLHKLLRHGPVRAQDVLAEAKKIGIARRTLYRAKATLGVDSIREGQTGRQGGGTWAWQLGD